MSLYEGQLLLSEYAHYLIHPNTVVYVLEHRILPEDVTMIGAGQLTQREVVYDNDDLWAIPLTAHTMWKKHRSIARFDHYFGFKLPPNPRNYNYILVLSPLVQLNSYV